jgi:DNA gyrase subunit B
MLIPTDGSEPITGEVLRQLVQEHSALNDGLAKLARRYDSFVLERLRHHVPLPADENALPGWAEAFYTDLNQHGNLNGSYHVQAGVLDGHPHLTVSRMQHGAQHTVVFSEDFFTGNEYRLLSNAAVRHQSLFTGGLTVRRGNREKQVQHFAEAYEWLLGDAKRGLHIQRYKGLGEMNPEQLHETTLDPKNRRLVQVSVEDAVAADQIFTTLMGDDVEPRREFIEKHALLVGNLDI